MRQNEDIEELTEDEEKNAKENEGKWEVYLLECLDGSYYTGISNDIKKRMRMHKSGKGSKYVSSRGFANLIATKIYPNKSEALKAEYKIKQLSKNEKVKFFFS